MMEKTQWHSWQVGNVPKGCKLCVKGKKTVLFITGLCSKNKPCYYCPVADNRSSQDVIFANETKINAPEDLCNEIKLCSSGGIGITGGDPLMKLDRVVEYIKCVKKEFGSGFHIHLYSPLDLVSESALDKLHESGLDEIRLHLDMEDKNSWHKLLLAKKFNWKVGVEVPVVPGKDKEFMDMIAFIKGKVDFLNLNELELSDSETCKLLENGFLPKDEYSYAVDGSEGLALKLLKHCEGINTHYCTIRLKDGVQIPNRLKNRLKNVKRSFDEVNGYNLVRGAIYTKDLKPSFSYRQMLDNIKDKKEVIKNLENIKSELLHRLSIKKDMMAIDESKLRILTSSHIARKFSDKIKSMDLVPAVVEELPSGDQFEIEIDFV